MTLATVQPGTAPHLPTRRRVFFLAWSGAVLAWSLLLFSYHYLDLRLSGQGEAWAAPLINEFSGGLAAGLLFFPVCWLVAQIPLGRGRALRRLPLYGLAGGLFAAIHTSLMWGLRTLAYPLASLGAYDYGRMPLRYFMEMPMQLIGFISMVAVLHGLAGLRAARERHLRTARLEASLAQAQLHNLRLQLQPHFLFNALNTISSTMYEDPHAADEMIEALAELLRTSLRSTHADQVSLGQELEVLDHYLALQRARFGDRLRVAMEVEPGIEEAQVPSLLLQPLVENAVRHGNLGARGTGSLTLRARRKGDRLRIEVEDDGPGAAPGALENQGVGLRATRERLRLLYGVQHAFTAANGPLGGFRVCLELPYDPIGAKA